MFGVGLSTGLVIEQVLMRSLTRGKGMTENQCLVWLMSMPACAGTNEAKWCVIPNK